jgi:hypothetical protein
MFHKASYFRKQSGVHLAWTPHEQQNHFDLCEIWTILWKSKNFNTRVDESFSFKSSNVPSYSSFYSKGNFVLGRSESSFDNCKKLFMNFW